MLRIAVLDDFQGVSERYADWSTLPGPAEVTEVAHQTAAILVGTGRAAHDPEVTSRLVTLVDDLGLSTVADAVTEAEWREGRDKGVCAEIGGVQLDAEGRPVATSLTERLISIDAERLRAVDDVIGLVYGAEKAGAVRAALQGGFVTSLVTHGAMARALLDP